MVGRILGNRQSNRGGRQSRRFVGLGAGQHREDDLAGAEHRRPRLPLDELTVGREDRTHRHEIVVGNAGFP